MRRRHRLSVARISRRICEWANKPDLLRIAVGELAKLLLVKQSYRGSWDKFSVLRELKRRELNRLASLWRLYITVEVPPLKIWLRLLSMPQDWLA